VSIGDTVVWLLLLAASVMIFFALPLVGGVGNLNRQGLRLVIAGIPVVVKLIHSVVSDQKPKSK
jgi:hypothetical protein